MGDVLTAYGIGLASLVGVTVAWVWATCAAGASRADGESDMLEHCGGCQGCGTLRACGTRSAEEDT